LKAGFLEDPAKSETWVKFSLRMVEKELKKRGKSRSIAEIKQAYLYSCKAVYKGLRGLLVCVTSQPVRR
jgi:hypothetical protein